VHPDSYHPMSQQQAFVLLVDVLSAMPEQNFRYAWLSWNKDSTATGGLIDCMQTDLREHFDTARAVSMTRVDPTRRGRPEISRWIQSSWSCGVKVGKREIGAAVVLQNARISSELPSSTITSPIAQNTPFEYETATAAQMRSFSSNSGRLQ
jgi:hypothetical protein